jgi:hypothetical protein
MLEQKDINKQKNINSLLTAVFTLISSIKEEKLSPFVSAW